MESEEGAAVVTCNTCSIFGILTKQVGSDTWSKCKLAALLEEKVWQLEARILNHQQINKLELLLDGAVQTILDKETGHTYEEEVASLSLEVDAWGNVTRTTRRPRDRSESLKLQNPFQPLSLITSEVETREERLVPPDNLSLVTLEEQQEQNEGLSLNRVDQVEVDEQAAGESLLLLGNSIMRNTERWIYDGHDNHMVTCLPGAKVAGITRNILLDRTGKEQMVKVHVDTNDDGKAKRSVLKAKFRLLGRRLKSWPVLAKIFLYSYVHAQLYDQPNGIF